MAFEEISFQNYPLCWNCLEEVEFSSPERNGIEIRVPNCPGLPSTERSPGKQDVQCQTEKINCRLSGIVGHPTLKRQGQGSDYSSAHPSVLQQRWGLPGCTLQRCWTDTAKNSVSICNLNGAVLLCAVYYGSGKKARSEKMIEYIKVKVDWEELRQWV